MNIDSENIFKNGFLNIEIPQNLNLVKEITELKNKKNAVILAHFYVPGEIQDIADFVGDSLALSQQAANTNASMIVFAGVHFMAETAKILSPEKKVILPDLNAGCSLADSCPVKDFAEFKKKHPDCIVISYVNTTAEIKALSDVICTSSNAKEIVMSFPEAQKIIFGPDRNLGNYINSITGRNMILWDGACHVHRNFSIQRVLELKKSYPQAKVISHPECPKEILLISDFIGSTSALLNYSLKDSSTTFIVATESGILHQMQKKSKNKLFIPAPPDDSTCACNDCNFMKLNTLKKLYIALKYELPEIIISDELRIRAVNPINKMLEISAKLGL